MATSNITAPDAPGSWSVSLPATYYQFVFAVNTRRPGREKAEAIRTAHRLLLNHELPRYHQMRAICLLAYLAEDLDQAKVTSLWLLESLKLIITFAGAPKSRRAALPCSTPLIITQLQRFRQYTSHDRRTQRDTTCTSTCLSQVTFWWRPYRPSLFSSIPLRNLYRLTTEGIRGTGH